MLPEVLQAPLSEYISKVDRDAVGALEAIYVVGSVALGDFDPRTSNVDVVAVAAGGWRPEALAVAAKAQRRLDRRRPACVAYVSAADLAGPPRDAVGCCIEGGRRVALARLVNPLTWRLVATSAIDVRGPDFPAVGDDASGLRVWAAEQLTAGWRPAPRRLRRVGGMWRRPTVAAAVLEVSRLVAAYRGSALSKVESAREAAAALPPRFSRIVEDSIGYRQGARTSMYWGPLERKNDALDLLDQLSAVVPGGDRRAR